MFASKALYLPYYSGEGVVGQCQAIEDVEGPIPTECRAPHQGRNSGGGGNIVHSGLREVLRTGDDLTASSSLPHFRACGVNGKGEG